MQISALFWFRDDLRLADNPGLHAACQHGPVLPVYILDDINAGEYSLGAASRWWLHHSLKALQASLEGHLSFYHGNPIHILKQLAKRYAIDTIHWNRCYQSWQIERDKQIKAQLMQAGINVQSHHGALLWEPWTVHKNDGNPYQVFTPFFRQGCMRAPEPRQPLPQPNRPRFHHDAQGSIKLEALSLLPTASWGYQLKPHWHVGEEAAHKQMQQFIVSGLQHYENGRNQPAKPHVSRLSAHLRFGEISPQQVWHTVRRFADDNHVDRFCSELGWREFSYHLLYHHPTLPKQNLQAKFDHFPWRNDEAVRKAWEQGRTGIPMVDAGMRELWQTGYMHNRVRMIVGSFLVKNCLIDWRWGAQWFWDCLVDADLANNSASWQWIAGCGADAAPYFRIFNPVRQGHMFDPDGEYIRRYLPEIAQLPNKVLFSPWEASHEQLQQAGVQLGVDYPKPIVCLQASRIRALDAYQTMKSAYQDSVRS